MPHDPDLPLHPFSLIGVGQTGLVNHFDCHAALAVMMDTQPDLGGPGGPSQGGSGCHSSHCFTPTWQNPPSPMTFPTQYLQQAVSCSTKTEGAQ